MDYKDKLLKYAVYYLSRYSSSKKNLEYILKNIERSYDKVFKFIKEIDNDSLSSGKSINIDLIKKNIRNE